MLARILLGLILCGLVACGGNSRAPVEDRTAESQRSAYTVKRGDTLYSISFRYGLDFRTVAAANGIAAPYTIYPGQQIYVNEGSLPRLGNATRSGPAPAPSPLYRTPPSAVPATPIAVAPAPIIKDKPPVSVATASPASVDTAPVAKLKQETAATYVGGKVDTWLWPAGGTVSRGYSESVHKGIDIGGERGEPIVAVAAGKVVYAGTGIVGFGELLIIKHNEVYLSAYGHNERLL
ncbi:MAG TPA: LysM peptidoglycan-binding domain-containing protein, partial [Halioglobus sp.]